jgi:hypothetical protein
MMPDQSRSVGTEVEKLSGGTRLGRLGREKVLLSGIILSANLKKKDLTA